MEEPENIAVIAISGRKLAIFGSNVGFAGPVIQDYVPFENEAQAISEAYQRMISEGRAVHREISRPVITSIRATYRKRR